LDELINPQETIAYDLAFVNRKHTPIVSKYAVGHGRFSHNLIQKKEKRFFYEITSSNDKIQETQTWNLVPTITLTLFS